MIAATPPEERRPLPHTVLALTGGAAPTSAAIEAMEMIGFKVLHGYGLTETFGPCLFGVIQDGWATLPIERRTRLMARQGVRPVTCAGAVVIDPATGSPVPADGATLGEIAVRGNTVMKGYLKDRAATEAAFREGWFRTGDLAVVHPDNYIESQGPRQGHHHLRRREHLLDRNRGGIQPAPRGAGGRGGGETRSALGRDTLRLHRPQAWNGAPSEDELATWCKAYLAGFKRPRVFRFGELPKTATGKVQKTILRERAAQL